MNQKEFIRELAKLVAKAGSDSSMGTPEDAVPGKVSRRPVKGVGVDARGQAASSRMFTIHAKAKMYDELVAKGMVPRVSRRKAK